MVLLPFGRRSDGDAGARRGAARSLCGSPTRRLARRSSPSDQAWNGQPPGLCGGSPSAISETWPSPATSRCARNGARKRSSRLALRLGRVAAHPQPGFDERPEQPGPDRALVVGAIALPARRRRSAAGSRARRAPASAGRAASAACARPSRPRGSHRARPGPDSGRPPTARIWFGPQRRIVAAGDVVDVDHVVQAAARPRSRSAAGTRPARARSSAAYSGAGAPAICSAFSHSAWTSTGLPIRGVTTRSPTLASIQVSCTPGTPAASRPSSSMRMPKRVPAR